MPIDYRGRLLAILAANNGNTSAVARQTGISRRSQRRILQGRETVGAAVQEARFTPRTGSIKTAISTAYRRVATQDQRAGERRYGKAQPKLLNYEQAKKFEARMRKLDIEYKVVAQQEVEFQRRTAAGLGRVEEDTIFVKGDSVDDVRQEAEERLERRENGTSDSPGIMLVQQRNEDGEPIPIAEPKYRIYLPAENRGAEF